MSRGEHPWSSATESHLKTPGIREIRVISKVQLCSQPPLPAWNRTVHHILLQGSAISVTTEDTVLSRSPTHYVNQALISSLPRPSARDASLS